MDARKKTAAKQPKIPKTPRLSAYPIRLVEKVKTDGRRQSRKRLKQKLLREE